jgi:hypothetical protein
MERHMTKPKPTAPEASDDRRSDEVPARQEPGTNAVEHEPDPGADATPDGETRHIKRSPYTTGND